MPIFGQVWLWSSLAFLLGAFLCWALVARPGPQAGRSARGRAELAAPRAAAQPGVGPCSDEEYAGYVRGRAATVPRRTPDPAGATIRVSPPSARVRRPGAPGRERRTRPSPLTRAYALPTPRARPELPQPAPHRRSRRAARDRPRRHGARRRLSARRPACFAPCRGRAGSRRRRRCRQPGGRGWFDSDADAAAASEPLEGISKLDGVRAGRARRGPAWSTTRPSPRPRRAAARSSPSTPTRSRAR